MPAVHSVQDTWSALLRAGLVSGAPPEDVNDLRTALLAAQSDPRLGSGALRDVLAQALERLEDTRPVRQGTTAGGLGSALDAPQSLPGRPPLTGSAAGARATAFRQRAVQHGDVAAALAAVKRLVPGGLSAGPWEGPPAGCPVLTPGPGIGSLISPPPDLFDAATSYKANREALIRGEIRVPRYAQLSAEERAIESDFAGYAEARPKHAVEAVRALAEKDGFIFEVDAAKRLANGYGRGGKPKDDSERDFRLRHNHVLHPTAFALTQLAFLQRLDELAELPEGDPKRQVFVTNGGCAAGKGSLTELVKRQLEALPFGAVWDAAGEGDALECSWILRACQARGLPVLFGYADADPRERYADVLRRAVAKGRVVDVVTFVNSYLQGSHNLRAFLESAEYQKATSAQGPGVTKVEAAALGMNMGPYDAQTGSYKDAKPLGSWDLGGDARRERGMRSSDVPEPPARHAADRACMEILESAIAKMVEEGLPIDALLHGALGAVAKFCVADASGVLRLLGAFAQLRPPPQLGAT